MIFLKIHNRRYFFQKSFEDLLLQFILSYVGINSCVHKLYRNNFDKQYSQRGKQSNHENENDN